MEKVYLAWLRKLSGSSVAHLINSSALLDKLFHPWHQPIILYVKVGLQVVYWWHIGQVMWCEHFIIYYTVNVAWIQETQLWWSNFCGSMDFYKLVLFKLIIIFNTLQVIIMPPFEEEGGILLCKCRSVSQLVIGWSIDKPCPINN